MKSNGSAVNRKGKQKIAYISESAGRRLEESALRARRRNLILTAAAAGLLGLYTSGKAATTFTTTTTATGNWSLATNWGGGTAPTGNQAGNIATNGAATITLTLDVATTIGQIKDTQGSAHGFIIDASGNIAMTMDNTGGTTDPVSDSNAFIGSTSSGGITFQPNIVMQNTNLDLYLNGSTQPTLTIGVNGGNSTITANTAGLTLYTMSDNGAAAGITIYSSIGSTGNLITVDNVGTGTRTVSLNGSVGPNAAVIQNSATTILALNASNSFTGNTTISAGTIQLGNTTAIPSVSNVFVNGTGTLNINGFSDTIGALNGSGTVENTSATAATLTVGGNSSSGTFSGVIGNTSLSLAVAGNGSETLTGANTYGGNTTIAANGILSVGNGSTTGTLGTTGHIIDNGTFIINNSGSMVQGANFSSSAITGTGGFTQLGGGTTTFNTANSYSGPTIVSVGTLTLGNGSSTNLIASSSAINVASGATLNVTGLSGGGITLSAGKTLTGAGTVAGNVTTVSTSIITPGTVTSGDAGNGTLTVGNLTLVGGSVFNFGLNSGNATNNFVSAGTLTLPGSGSVTLDLYSPGTTTPFAAAGTYDLFQYSTLSGTLSNSDFSFGTSIAGYSGNFTASGGYLQLTLTAAGTIASWNNGDATGNWSDPNNWSGGVTPMNAGDAATFGNLTNGGTVSLDQNETVGGITFNSANSYTISGSGTTLTLNNNGAGATIADLLGNHTIGVSISIADTAGLTVSPLSGTQLTLSGNISATNSQSLTMNGAGTLVLSGNNTYGPAAGSVGTTLGGGGILQLGGNSALAAGDLNVISSSTIQAGGNLSVANNVVVSTGAVATVDSQTNAFTLSGNISGSGSLAKVGSGTLLLSNSNNSYSGGTVVNAGILSVSSDGSAGANAQLGLVPSSATANNVILNGGDLFGNGTFTLNANRGIGIGPTTGSTGGTGSIDAASGQTLTIPGVIASAGNSGANNLVINGAGGTGTVILNNPSNSYTGMTYVSGGTLQLGNSTALQNSTLNLNSPNGTLSFGSLTAASIAGLAGNQPLSLTSTGGNVSLTLGNGNVTSNFSGNLSGGGSITAEGSTNTVTLSNANFTGSVTVGTGGGTAQGLLTITGGTFGSSSATLTIASTEGNAFIMSGGNATFGTVNVAITGGNTGGGGEITGGNATIGTLTIGSGTGSPNHAGAFIINDPGGTVSITTADIVRDEGSGLVVDNGTVTVGSLFVANSDSPSGDLVIGGGSLTVGNSSVNGAFELGTSPSTNTLTMTGGSLTYLGTDGLLIGNNTSGTAANAATINGNTSVATLTGVTLNSGNVSSGSPTTATLTVGTGATLYLGSVGLVANGDSAGGNVSFNFGNATIGAYAAWNSSAPITLQGNTTTVFQTGNATGTAYNIGLGGTLSGNGGLAVAGNGTLTLTGANSYTGLTTLSSGTLNINGEGAVGGANYSGMKFNGGILQYATSLSSSGDITQNSVGAAKPVTIGPSGATIDTNGNSITYLNSIGNSGNGGLTIADSQGTGKLTLLAAATYTGNTSINSGATLQLGNGTAGFDGSITSSPAITDNGNLVYDRSTGNTFSYAGPIGGTGTVTMSGTGTQTLSGASSYSGGTTITSGTLNVTNSSGSATGSGNVSVTGGTLGGNGAIAATVNVNGGTVAPGAPGTNLTVGGLTYNSGNLSFSLNGNSSSEISAGNVTFNAALTSSTLGLIASASTLSTGDQEILINSSTPITNISDAAGIVERIGRLTLTTAAINNNDTIVLNVVGNPANLIWAGGNGALGTGTAPQGDGSTWNNNQASGGSNWDNAGNYDYFYDADNVTFSNTVASAYTVNLTTNNSPGSVTVNAPGVTYVFESTGNNGSITGAGNLTVAAGTLQLNTSNTYTGGTTIAAGALIQTGSSSALPNAGTVTVNGTLDLNNNSQTIASLSDSGSGTGIIQNSVGSQTLTVTAGGSFSGNMTNGSSNSSLALQLTGGTLGFSGTGNYSGATSVTGGNLSLTGSLTGSSIATSGSGIVTESSSGVIAGSGATFTQGSTGTSVLAGNNNAYTGLTTVTSGTLIDAASGANDTAFGNSSSSSGGLFLNPTSGTATVDFNSPSPSIASLSSGGAGNSSVVLSSSTNLSVTGANASNTFGGIISGNGALTVAGGNLNLTGSDTYVGNTTVAGGILTVGNSTAITNSAGLVVNGGIVQFSSAITSQTLKGLSGTGGMVSLTNLGNGNVSLTLNNTVSESYAGNLSGSGSLIVSGNVATTTLANANFTGSITVGTAANPNTVNGELTINGGSFGSSTSNLTIAQDAGPTGVVYAFVMNGGNATFGTVNIGTVGGETGSALEITGGNFTSSTITLGGNPANLNAGNSGGSITITGGNVNLGTTYIGRDEVGTTCGLVINGNGAVVTSSSLDVSSNAGAPAHEADFNMQNGSYTIGNSMSTGAFVMGTAAGDGNNVLAMTGGTLTYLGTDGLQLEYNTIATISGGTANLSAVAVNSNTTGNSLSEFSVTGGALYLAGDASGVGLTVNAPGTSVYAQFGNATVGALGNWTSAAPITLISSATTVFQSGNSTGTPYNIALSGNLSGGGALTVTGSGTLTLTGASSYSGGTTINSGMLRGNGASALGAGAVTIAGGNIAVGDGVTTTAQTLTTTGGEKWNSGGYAPRIFADGSADNLTTGNVSLGASDGSPFSVTATGTAGTLDGQVNYQWQVATLSSLTGYTDNGGTLPTNGQTEIVATAGVSGTQFALNVPSSLFGANSDPENGTPVLELIGTGSGYDLDIGYNVAPEPGTAMLVLSGTMPVLLSRRRRKNMRASV